MIVTLTLNPSLDRTVEVPSLDRGVVVRATAVQLEPGGKGVNVTRALIANGVKSRAVVARGSDEGWHLFHLLEDAGIDVVPIDVRGATRSNITLAEPDGTTTKINEPGAALLRIELEALADAVLAAAGSTDWVVLSGRLPPGVPDDHYADLTERFRAAGINVAVDTSGPALRHAVAAGPALVKPNVDELASVVGAPIISIGDAVAGAECLRAQGAAAVLSSLGADGALLVDADGVAHATCPAEVVRSAVGAGDALLAGFLSTGGHGHVALRTAVAWGAAAVARPGSSMPAPADIHPERASISADPDLTRALSP